MASLADLDLTPLLDAGFKKMTQKEWQTRVDEYKALGMDNGGTYDFGYELIRGRTTIMIEQNVSTIVGDGLETMTKHPAVATVTGPRGRVTVNATETDLILAMADEVA